MVEEKRVGERITYTTRGLANYDVPKQVRYNQIIEILKNSKEPMTAKEIAIIMFNKGLIPSDERNFTSPRLTELGHKGIVEPVDKKYCSWSGKLVSRWQIREDK